MQDNFNIHNWRLEKAINEEKTLNVTFSDEDWSQSIAYKLSDALIKSGYSRDMIKSVAKSILTRHSLQENKGQCPECGCEMEGKMCNECGYMGEGFPDLSGDGKITQKDILIAKGVIKKENIEDWQRFYEEGYRAGYEHAKAGVKPMYEGEDHEVSMAQNSLKSIMSSASQLMNKLGNEERDIPGWIQDHITNAENFIDQAAQGFHELDK